jgi:transcriptional regulator with PAS, ATPase and Fis domain
MRGRIENMLGDSRAFRTCSTWCAASPRFPAPSPSTARAAPARNSSPAPCTSSAPAHPSPFVAINCGGIPEQLLESELFGYKKGAFTGANEDKEGLFVSANGGTIFLDEIGEMPLMLQVKLLRVLDNSTVTPVGGTQSIKVDVRIISATNRDLKKMSDKGDFRSDLYYRLNVIPIMVPPLRERADDIPLLAAHFVQAHAAAMQRPPHRASRPRPSRLLRHYTWPGNVRELSNTIERVCRAVRRHPYRDSPISPTTSRTSRQTPSPMSRLSHRTASTSRP